MPKAIIIGSGPAGVSAALYIKRAGIDTSVITAGIGALSKAEKIENYYGFETPVSGKELYERGIEGAKKLGIEFIPEEVVGITYEEKLTVVTDKNKYAADAVLIATGAARKTPAIEGLKEFEGRGVSYCAVCDGFFFRGKKAAILGNGEYAAHEAEYLSQLVSELYVLTNGETNKLPSDVKGKIIEKKIKRVSGTEKMEKVEFLDGETLDTNGLFIAYGTAGSAALAKTLGAAESNGKIIVNDKMETNVPGVYAAGDCTGGLYQVAKAVYEGAAAGTAMVKFIRGNSK